MDILSVAILDLNDFGIDGWLKFRRMPASKVAEYRQYSQELTEKSTEEQVHFLSKTIDEYFIKGEIKQEDGVIAEFTEIGDIDMGVLSEAILLISGSQNKKK